MLTLQQAHLIFSSVVKSQYKKAKTEKEQNWIKLKEKHSLEVLSVGFELIERRKSLKISKKLKAYFLMSLLLHDIGRFFQFKNGDIDLKINHGELGCKILTKKYGVTSNHILLPIKYHDRLDFVENIKMDTVFISLDRNTQKEIMCMSKLLVDADRLANYRMHKENGIVTIGSKNLTLQMNPYVLAALKTMSLVNLNHVRHFSFVDLVIFIMCWQFNTYSVDVKRIIKEEKINRFFMKSLIGSVKETYAEVNKSFVAKLQYRKIKKQIIEIINYLKLNKLF